jgi:hypothetical protein
LGQWSASKAETAYRGIVQTHGNSTFILVSQKHGSLFACFGDKKNLALGVFEGSFKNNQAYKKKPAWQHSTRLGSQTSRIMSPWLLWPQFEDGNEGSSAQPSPHRFRGL